MKKIIFISIAVFFAAGSVFAQRIKSHDSQIEPFLLEVKAYKCNSNCISGTFFTDVFMTNYPNKQYPVILNEMGEYKKNYENPDVRALKDATDETIAYVKYHMYQDSRMNKYLNFMNNIILIEILEENRNAFNAFVKKYEDYMDYSEKNYDRLTPQQKSDYLLEKLMTEKEFIFFVDKAKDTKDDYSNPFISNRPSVYTDPKDNPFISTRPVVYNTTNNTASRPVLYNTREGFEKLRNPDSDSTKAIKQWIQETEKNF
ncbi:MAG: hypothetical protein LBI01_04635 [Elusimicrobium sp.]|jgi:hypothetical protein|nr:hypothetical protein [Elusimicrobium sp.]